MAAKETIAVLGAGGMMGFAMARNLARDGYDVRAWNRSRDKAQPLTADGAEVLDSPAEAAAGATVILTMLPDADAVLDTMDGDRGVLSATLGHEPVWLQMSTIGEAGTERCVGLARKHALEFVDAPVLGTKAPAEQGELVILASGPNRLRDRVQPIFDVLGQRTMWVGGVGDGSRLKLATNSWILAVVEGAAETLALAEGLGIEPQLVLDALAGGPLDLPYLRMKGKAILNREFEPSFRLALAAKDASLVQEAAERHELDLPLVRTVSARLDEAVPEHGDRDIAATYLTSAPPGATQS
ncbi:MAG: NAD(P)-dependent oxidoreductase [Solirubrobacteraceae bacterium]